MPATGRPIITTTHARREAGSRWDRRTARMTKATWIETTRPVHRGALIGPAFTSRVSFSGNRGARDDGRGPGASTGNGITGPPGRDRVGPARPDRQSFRRVRRPSVAPPPTASPEFARLERPTGPARLAGR